MAIRERGNARRAFRVLAALSTALLVFGLTGGTAGGQQDDFVPGSGRADARIIRVGPSAAQLSLAPTIGVALADYQTSIGRGESLVFDWVALDGSIPESFKDETHSLRADTQADEECWDRERYLPADPPAHRTTQLAQANPQGPFGSSEFHLEGFEIPGALSLKGGVARSEAHLEGTVRTAHAVTDIPELSLGDGAVVLSGLRWEAFQRTDGDGPAQPEATFNIEAMTIAGQPMPIPDGLHELAGAINGPLAPMGISLQLPTLNTDGGIARMTPLGINIFPSEPRQELFGPAIGAFDDNLREGLVNFLFDLGEDIDGETGADAEAGVADGERGVEFIGCPGDPQPQPETEGGSSVPAMPMDSAVLVADIVLGVTSGTGSLNLHLGGVMAFTEGERFDDPFGDRIPFEPTGPIIQEIPGTPGTPGIPPAEPSEQQLVAAPSSVDQVRGTEPGSRGGVAVLIGAIGLALALALAATDWYYIRRYRAVLPVGPRGG